MLRKFEFKGKMYISDGRNIVCIAHSSYAARKANVSKRAQKTLELIEKGRYYPDEFDQNKPVIVELLKAGLIAPAMRVITIQRHFVPTSGYTPYEPERYEAP